MSTGICPLVCLIPLALIALASTSRSAGAEEQPKAEDPLAAAIQPFVDSHSLAGAVMLVANKDKMLNLSAVGYADVAAHRPMPADALFWIASESKPITATAFMMLVDEGKVRLDDPVAAYLPEFHNLWVKAEQTEDRLLLKRPHHAITVREILSHTAGMPFSSPLEHPTLDTLPLRVAVSSYAMTPLDHEPGTKYQYSNAGINTAGRIIEVVSGMPYEKFLDERLFKPLGMTDTTFWPNKAQLARLAKAYKPSADKKDLEELTIGQLRYPLDDPTRGPMPAGGLFSTATDMGRFGQMLLNGGTLGGKRYISEAALHEMTTKQTPEGVPDGYGLGFSAGAAFGHGGAFATNFTVDTVHGLVLVWMIHAAGGFPNNGDQSGGAFHKAAIEHYGSGTK
jgi:CubicO group peptidase (beta-lactamase class C family)